jgi:hypothetical protein
MSEHIYTGTSGDDLVDGSALAAGDYMVFRSLGGSDTVTGSAGTDRFRLDASGDSVFGGDGRDQFFVTLGNHPGAVRDSIDGGSGSDELIITVSTTQMTMEFKAELGRLQGYLASHATDPTAHFTSDILHLDMVNVEDARVRLDGVMHALPDLLPSKVENASFSTIGDVSLNAADHTVGSASLDLNSNWVSAADLETFLGLPDGALSAVGTVPTDGSAAKATIHVMAGHEVSFDWKFNAGDYNPYDDTGYAIFGTSAVKLSSVDEVGNYQSSGWHTGHFTAAVTGDYTLGFAVTNAYDTVNNSHLLVDHVLIG